MIDFYCGSGSPYAWRVWLALEHKAVPYELHMLSFSAGDLRTDAFRAINPRGRVPAITDGDLALGESAAIVEYLEDAYPQAGQPLFPADAKARAHVRRMVRDADEYVAHALEALVDELLFKPPGEADAAAVAAGRQRLVDELAAFEGAGGGPFLAGSAGAADFTLYPMVALALRMEERRDAALGIRAALGPRLTAWMAAVAALPSFERTYPPHWRTA